MSPWDLIIWALAGAASLGILSIGIFVLGAVLHLVKAFGKEVSPDKEKTTYIHKRE